MCIRDRGEIVCIAGIDGNGQSELVYALTGLMPSSGGRALLRGEDILHESIRRRNLRGLGHIPEDRHKFGLVLDYTLEENLVLKNYFAPQFQRGGFLKHDAIEENADRLIVNKATFQAACEHASGAIIGSKFVTLLEEEKDPEKAITRLKEALK